MNIPVSIPHHILDDIRHFAPKLHLWRDEADHDDWDGDYDQLSEDLTLYAHDIASSLVDHLHNCHPELLQEHP